MVSPFVFAVPGRLPVAPSPEVQAALWVPVAEVLDRSSRRPFLISRAGQQMEFSAIHAGGLVIWGLTERILSQLEGILMTLA